MNIYWFIFMSAYICGASPKQFQTMHQTQIRKVADPQNTGNLNKAAAIAQYRKEVQQFSAENKKIPKKDDSIFRIMTYNVHYWRNPEDAHTAMNEIMDVIYKINPDILILQEVSPSEGFAQGKHFDRSQAMHVLQNMGFIQFSACNTVSKGWFGNVIASKKKFVDVHRYFFKGQKENQSESRCYTVAQTILPAADNVYIYGTHLEVRDDSMIRLAQIQEIIQRINWEMPNSNALLAADFNATRKSVIVQQLQQAGYIDCFTYMGWEHPTFTTWAGTEIDFIFLSPKWHLPLAGCYIYYDAASDHLPVIMDINLLAEKSFSALDTNYLQELLQTLQRDLQWLQSLIA